ncbi:MAG: hypothetical protein ACLFQB_10855 [Chitinispirillaceae bacterium]
MSITANYLLKGKSLFSGSGRCGLGEFYQDHNSKLYISSDEDVLSFASYYSENMV